MRHSVRAQDRAGFSRLGLTRWFHLQAPLVFVFCCEIKDHFYGRRGLDLYTIQDATIAETFAILACQEEGLSRSAPG